MLRCTRARRKFKRVVRRRSIIERSRWQDILLSQFYPIIHRAGCYPMHHPRGHTWASLRSTLLHQAVPSPGAAGWDRRNRGIICRIFRRKTCMFSVFLSGTMYADPDYCKCQGGPYHGRANANSNLELSSISGRFFFGVQLEVGGAFEPVPVAGGPGGQLSVVVDELEGELEGALVKLVSWVDDDDDDGIVVAV